MDMRPTIPGITREDVHPTPSEALRTGVPAFLAPMELAAPIKLGAATHLGPELRDELRNTATLAAIAGFFAAGGGLCYVVGCDPKLPNLDPAFAAIDELELVDLVAAPDLARGLTNGGWSEEAERRATALLAAGRATTRLTLLSAPGPANRCNLENLAVFVRALKSSPGFDVAALYHPWVVHAGVAVPPDGHIAGVIAATDARVGVHKPPANEVVRGLLDLDVAFGPADLETLAGLPINSIRAMPGRGIRVWGARTLAGEPVSVRRTLLTIRRELARRFAAYAFAANDAWLWQRIARELGAYLHDLFQRGVLRGKTVADAYRIRCDHQTNPPEHRAAGIVCAEIGVAPATPREFITLRLRVGAEDLAASVDETIA